MGPAGRDGAPGLRLLVINWLDRENPQAGGAEIQLHEIFGRMAARGHEITLLVSGWRDGPAETTLDGMRVLRTGRRYTFPLHAWRTYRRHLRDRPFDLVVEDVNKFPLFTPLWSRSPVVIQVPHLFGEVAFREESWPVAAAVWLAERLMPPVYRASRVHAVSESTARDLVDRGFDPERIRVIHNGVDHAYYRPAPGVERFPEPTFVYVGRLKRYKEMEVVLRAVARLEGEGRSVQLRIAGKGDDRPRLEREVRELGIGDRVEFLGWIQEAEKRELLRRAWALVYPSPKEGWGIANVEAAACGTPAVASDSPGLRDAVVHGESGLLVPHDDIAAWSRALRRLAGDPELRASLAEGALRHARRFSWERAADETERDLIEVLRQEGGRHADHRRGASLRGD